MCSETRHLSPEGSLVKCYCFDFDGTITKKDSLLEFIRYTRGTARLFQTFLLYSPILVLMKLHLYSNYKAKQKIFTYLYKGESIEDFNRECSDFARDNAYLLRESAKTKIHQALAEGSKVLIVSASIDNWVKPFFRDFIIPDREENNEGISVIGTQIEVVEGKLTGRFLTGNCYGQEKVNRIKKVLTAPRNHYEIVAYGDSRGDREMLEYADKRFYKPFRR